MSADLFFRLGNLVGMGSASIQDDTSTPNHRPGSISFVMDAYGYPRIFKYIKNKRGSALTASTMVMKPANVAVTNMTTASTATQIVTSGLTASAHDGKMVLIQMNTGGTAPDGETGICKSNTATLVNLEADYALTAAPNSGSDDAVIVANWQGDIATFGTQPLAVNNHGVLLGTGGLSDGNFGWIQAEGPATVKCTTTAIAVNTDVIISGTAGSVATGGGAAQENWVGFTMAASVTNSTKALVYLKLFTCAGVGASP